MFLLCSSDFGRSLEESRDDLQSLGYDTPVPLIRSDSYTTLLDATDSRNAVVLNYGQTYHFQGWTITASTQGTRFTNDQTGHGMFVSIENTYPF